MVKKLFKYEMIAYRRTLLPVYAILLGVAALFRFVQLFETDSTIYRIVQGSSVFAYVVALLACFGFTWVFAIVRFYKNLFTGEGYLSFTLPVTPTQHILTKCGAAVLFSAISFAVALISACIVTLGDVLSEVCKAGIYLFGQIPNPYKADVVFYIIEFLVMLLVACAAGMLLYYTCIAIGQTFRKNRVLGAVGVYFIYYTATQILGTVLTVLVTVFARYLPLAKLEDWIYLNTDTFIHIVLCGATVLTAAGGVLCFFIIRGIMRKRLNLE